MSVDVARTVLLCQLIWVGRDYYASLSDQDGATMPVALGMTVLLC